METFQICCKNINNNCRICAYLNGDYNSDVLEVAKKAKYELGSSTKPGRMINAENLMFLPRTNEMLPISKLSRVLKEQ
jgi:hypothetical protein